MHTHREDESIPDDWVASRLDERADIISTRMSYSELETLASSTSPQSRLVLGIKVSDMNLPGNEIALSHSGLMKRVDTAVVEHRCAPPGTIVFPKRGAAIATNKKRLTTEWTVFDPNVIGVAARAETDTRFLFHWFQQFDLRTITDPGATPQLNKKNLEPLMVSAPKELREQQAIAAVLDRAEAAGEAEQRLLQQMQILKRASMRALFARGVRAARQRETQIGLVPETWDVISLGTLGRIGNGTTPNRTNPAYWNGGSIPWITSGRMYERRIHGSDVCVTPAALEDNSLPLLQPGAVLIAIVGQGKTLGHCAILDVKATVSRHVGFVQPNDSVIVPEFLVGYLESQYQQLRQLASGNGSTRGALTCAILRGLQVPVPPIDEQREIVAILDALERGIALHVRKHQVLGAIFDALLNKLMTTELRVDQLDLSALRNTVAPSGHEETA